MENSPTRRQRLEYNVSVLEEAHLSVTKMPRFKEFRFVRRLVHLERLPAGPLLGKANQFSTDEVVSSVHQISRPGRIIASLPSTSR